jgi:hypothetical protein
MGAGISAILVGLPAAPQFTPNRGLPRWFSSAMHRFQAAGASATCCRGAMT